jgi:hypothetical protein
VGIVRALTIQGAPFARLRSIDGRHPSFSSFAPVPGQGLPSWFQGAKLLEIVDAAPNSVADRDVIRSE